MQLIYELMFETFGVDLTLPDVWSFTLWGGRRLTELSFGEWSGWKHASLLQTMRRCSFIVFTEHQILINDTEATRQTLVSRRFCFDAGVMNLLSPFRLSLKENKPPLPKWQDTTFYFESNPKEEQLLVCVDEDQKCDWLRRWILWPWMFNLTQFAGKKRSEIQSKNHQKYLWAPSHLQRRRSAALKSHSTNTSCSCFFRDSFGWMSRFSEDGCSLSLDDHRDPEKDASGLNWIISDAPDFQKRSTNAAWYSSGDKY